MEGHPAHLCRLLLRLECPQLLLGLAVWRQEELDERADRAVGSAAGRGEAGLTIAAPLRWLLASRNMAFRSDMVCCFLDDWRAAWGKRAGGC